MTERESPYLWSTTALTNGGADPSINFAENQLPSTVNNSARSVMAAQARFLKDNNSSVSTGGSANAYTATVNSTVTAYATGHKYVLKANFSNTASCTLNVTNADATALGAKAIKVITSAGEADPRAFMIRANGHYIFEYDAAANSSAGAFILLNPTVDYLNLAPLRGYIDGLILANNAGTPNTKIDVGAGMCADSTNAAYINSSGTLTIDCGTTGANALDTGALANTTWYHAYVISKTDGTTASLASTSASSPTMPSGYTYKRRIGSFLTDGSAHIISFKQNGDEFIWASAVSNASGASPSGTTAADVTITVPSGLKVNALLRLKASYTGTGGSIVFGSEDETLAAAGSANVSMTFGVAQTDQAIHANLRTDTSSRVQYRASTASMVYSVQTFGWIDQRGRNG